MIGGKIKKQYLLLFDDIVGKCLFRNSYQDEMPKKTPHCPPVGFTVQPTPSSFQSEVPSGAAKVQFSSNLTGVAGSPSTTSPVCALTV